MSYNRCPYCDQLTSQPDLCLSCSLQRSAARVSRAGIDSSIAQGLSDSLERYSAERQKKALDRVFEDMEKSPDVERRD